MILVNEMQPLNAYLLIEVNIEGNFISANVFTPSKLKFSTGIYEQGKVALNNNVLSFDE